MSAKIAIALHEIMSKVGYVQKTGKNAFHNYKYAGEADLLDKLRPAMVEAGLMLLPSVKSVTPVDEHGNVTVMMEYTLIHKDGEVWPEKIGAAGMGNDRSSKGGVGDKGVYKAITGANKYVLFKLFQIETGDDPESSEVHDAPPMKSSAQLKRDNFWPDFERELEECGTLLMLEKFKSIWREKAMKDGWTAAWKAAAKDRIEGRERAIMNAMEAAELAEIPLKEALTKSLDNERNLYVDNLSAG